MWICVSDLSITHAFPCRCRQTDKEAALAQERDICGEMEKLGLILVGWYHSHPTFAASPSLKDIDAQLDHQMKLKGVSDSSYTPCVGLICCKLYFFYYFLIFYLVYFSGDLFVCSSLSP